MGLGVIPSCKLPTCLADQPKGKENMGSSLRDLSVLFMISTRVSSSSSSSSSSS